MSGKPDDAGYVESSFEDRLASHANIPTNVERSKNPAMKAIGNKAGTQHGFKLSTNAADGKSLPDMWPS